MTARLLIPPTATYEEWKAQRAELSRTAVTASEIATVLGISPWDSAFNLYWKKLGEIPDDYDDDTLSLGRHLEPWIADRWAADHPEWTVALGGLWANKERPWQMSTTDRDLYGPHVSEWLSQRVDRPIPESVVEVKHSGSYDGWGEDGSDEIPTYYRAQVLWQLDTLGLTKAHVTCFFLATRSRRDYVIAYEETDVKLMRDAAQEFLAQLYWEDPPPIDHHPATTSALKQLHPDVEDGEVEICEDLAYAYRQAKRTLDDAQADYGLLTNEVRAALGGVKTATSAGAKVATRSVFEQSRVDSKRLKAEFPDAYAACRTTSTVDKLTPARAKKEAS